MSKNKKQELLENPEELKNENHILECFFSEHINKFCLMFNAKIFTFNTWNGYVNKRKYFIAKYKLS